MPARVADDAIDPRLDGRGSQHRDAVGFGGERREHVAVGARLGHALDRSGSAARQRTRIEDGDRHGAAVGGANHRVEGRQRAVAAAPRRRGEPFAHHDERLSRDAQAAKVRGDGVQRRRRHLDAHRVGPLAAAGRDARFERRPRLVDPASPLELRDGSAHHVQVARQAERQQRIEGLDDEDHVARSERALDQAGQDRARLRGAVARRDVVLVQEDREEPRPVLRRLGLLISRRLDGPDLFARSRRTVRPDEGDRGDLPSCPVLEDLEIAGREGIDRAPRAIFGDGVDANGRRRDVGPDRGCGRRKRQHEGERAHVSS